MAHRSRRATFALVALIAVVVACSSSKDGGGDVQLRAGSFAVRREASDAAIVEEERLVFPRAGNDDLLARAPGDVLVGARASDGTTNTRGFLRRVVDVHVDGDTIVVDTTRATLDDAFSRLEIDGHLTPSNAPTTTSVHATSFDPPQLGVRGGPGGSANGHFELRWDHEWDLASGSSKGSDGNASWSMAGSARLGAHLVGTLDFDPAFDVSLHDWALRALLVGGVHSTVSATVEVDGNATGSFSYKLPFEYEEPIAFVLLDVPVEATLDITASVECDVEADAAIASTFGVDVSVDNVQVGIICGNGQPCATHFDHDAPQVSPIGPTLSAVASVTAKCSLKPDFALYLYDLIGPYGRIEPYVKGSIAGPPCAVKTSWGVDATIGLRGVIPFVHQPWYDTKKTFAITEQPLFAGALGDCGGSTEGLVGEGGEDSSNVVPLTDGAPLQPAHVAADATGVYWTDVGTPPDHLDGRILRRSSSGSGDAEVVLANRKHPSGIVLDGTSMYWVEWGDAANPWEAGAVYSLAKNAPAATTPKLLYAHLNRPFALAVDAETVFVSEADAEPLGQIDAIPLAGGSRRVLVRGLDQPLGIAVDDTNVYFTVLGNEGTGWIGAVSKAGAPSSIPAGTGTLRHLVDALADPIGIAVDASGLYAATSADASGGALWQIDPVSGTSKTIATGLSQPYALTLDKKFVLMGNGEELIGVPKIGGRPVAILRGIQPPVSLVALPSAAGGSTLVWTELGDASYRLPHGGVFATYFGDGT